MLFSRRPTASARPRQTCTLAALLLGSALAGQAAAEDAPAEREEVQVKFQATYIQQRHAAFPSRPPAPWNAANYSGDFPLYSLGAGHDKTYTGSFTAYLGLRPWTGGELYFNPEATVGVPFTGNLVGLGGFYNGEITRAAGTSPKLYRQRLFLRQTWNQGGGSEKIDSDLNWMAGTVDKNRFVLTVGNFSLLDIFDKNDYANDPRRQFMNWGGMASTAYDYAADARGFGWGVVGEWYRGNWALRLGRMTGPVQPNDLPVDLKLLQHYGDQLEIEHNHDWNGQPGAVRLLLWRNRARLAAYSDAIAYGNAVGWKPTENGMEYILNVRSGEKIKYGVGINTDQALSSDLGVFFRAMWADGKTETYAFGEVDRSWSMGAALKGTAWGRAKDTVGAAYLVNFLSPQRREYLAKGGISYFIGDGWLNYKPEQVIELYYSLALNDKAWISANYQRYAHPAYNADRGPVNILGVRLHTEF